MRVKKRKVGRYLVLFLIIGVLFYKYRPQDRFRNLSYFKISSVEIKGVDPVYISEVTEKLSVKKGTNLLLLDKDRLKKELTALPWVKGLTIKVLLPNRIGVEFVEREPIGVIGKKNRFLFDSEGIVFKNRRDAVFLLPHLAGVSGREKVVPAYMLDSYMELMSAVGRSGFQKRVSAPESWQVRVKNGNIRFDTDRYRFLINRHQSYHGLLNFLKIRVDIEDSFEHADSLKIDLRFDKRIVVNQKI